MLLAPQPPAPYVHPQGVAELAGPGLLLLDASSMSGDKPSPLLRLSTPPTTTNTATVLALVPSNTPHRAGPETTSSQSGECSATTAELALVESAPSGTSTTPATTTTTTTSSAASSTTTTTTTSATSAAQSRQLAKAARRAFFRSPVDAGRVMIPSARVINDPATGRVSHAVYDIFVQPCGRSDNWVIHRRFRNFVELDKALKSVVSGNKTMKPPRLPPKTLFVCTSKAFIEKRRQALDMYLQQVLLLEDLRRSRAFRDFLGMGPDTFTATCQPVSMEGSANATPTTSTAAASRDSGGLVHFPFLHQPHGRNDHRDFWKALSSVKTPTTSSTALIPSSTGKQKKPSRPFASFLTRRSASTGSVDGCGVSNSSSSKAANRAEMARQILSAPILQKRKAASVDGALSTGRERLLEGEGGKSGKGKGRCSIM